MRPEPGNPPMADNRLACDVTFQGPEDELDRLRHPSEALEIVLAHTSLLPTEHVSLVEAAGRILAADFVATSDFPPFPASTMDGYAVIANDGSPWRDVVGVQAAGQLIDAGGHSRNRDQDHDRRALAEGRGCGRAGGKHRDRRRQRDHPSGVRRGWRERPADRLGRQSRATAGFRRIQDWPSRDRPPRRVWRRSGHGAPQTASEHRFDR